MVALLLGISALAFSGFHFAESQKQRVALWRCIGIRKRPLLNQYVGLLLILGLISGVVGIVFGSLLSHLVIQQIASYIQVSTENISILTSFISLMGSLIMVAVFLFPTLIQLANQSPLSLLRPDSSKIKLPKSHWLPGLIYIVVIAFYWSDNIALWFGFIVAFGLLVVVLLGLGKSLQSIFNFSILKSSNTFRFVAKMMKTNQLSNLLQMLVISMILSLFGLVYLMSQSLFKQWQTELPPKTPNTFIFNVAPEEVTPIKNDLASLTINTTHWFPIARGRITSINNKSVTEALNPVQQQDNALKRELNITFSEQLDPNNKTLKGHWPPSNITKVNEDTIFPISIESGLLNRLGLKLNDSIQFSVGATKRIGKITHIRKVNWGTFKPNFFIIFPKQAQTHLFVTYLCSFFVDKGKQIPLDNKLKKYHSVSMIPVGKVLTQVRSIISEAGKMVQFSMSFIALLSFILLLTVLQMTVKQRLFQGLIIRAIGGSNRFINRILFLEWTILGCLSGLVAAIFVETGFNLVAVKLLQLEVKFHLQIWFALPILAVLILFVGGQGLRRRLTEQAPMTLLKEQAG